VVWMPSSVVVGADFAPYVSHGHWGLTASSSWLWVSDFSWGWAPFHYGRWVWIGGRGWGWIPGRVYSPAWVVWRTGFYDDYYVGWAPMPPTWYWHGGWAVRLGYVPYAPYVFCSSTHVFAPHVRPYLAPPARVGLIGPRTQPYVAAAPGVASTGHSPITMTRGPSMADAHIPMGSIPVQRVTPEARAVAFAQSRPQARPYASPQGGPLMGRGDMYGRTPGSSVPTTRPSGPGPQVYAPRPLSPAAAPMQPAMPVLPRPSPVMPSSTPRPYMPSAAVPQFNRPTPGSDFARPAPAPDFARSAPVIRPSAPAPVVRPSSPPPSVSRPSAAPHVSPSRPAAVPRNFSR
jgi:hypothetical protein